MGHQIKFKVVVKFILVLLSAAGLKTTTRGQQKPDNRRVIGQAWTLAEILSQNACSLCKSLSILCYVDFLPFCCSVDVLQNILRLEFYVFSLLSVGPSVSELTKHS